MRQEPIDVVEALSVLMDVMDLADGPENQAELDELTGVILKLIPDYLAVYPEKKSAVLAVLNRSHGVQVTSLDAALAWYSKQPEAPMPILPQVQTPEAETAKPAEVKASLPSNNVQPKPPRQKSVRAAAAKKDQPKPALLNRIKHWMRRKPEASSVAISDADEKRAALLKKLEAIRDGHNLFS